MRSASTGSGGLLCTVHRNSNSARLLSELPFLGLSRAERGPTSQVPQNKKALYNTVAVSLSLFLAIAIIQA